MSRFNSKDTHTNKKSSAIQTTGNTITNHYGAIGYERDAKSELYLLAVSFMGGDSNFYEKSDARYSRLRSLTRQVAIQDGKWMLEFVRWVRNGAMMRTVAGVMAVEAVMGRLAHTATRGEKDITTQGTINRQIIDAACARADEPQEMLAYYLSLYPKPIAQPVKKGLGDAFTRLINERSYLRWAANSTSAVGMADVIRLCRPRPQAEWQSHLFNYITEWEHRGPEAESTLAELEFLPKINARRAIMAIPQDLRRDFLGNTDAFSAAEMGWENVSAWLGSMDKEAWEAVIPNMGTMAILRNLRNFDKVGITDRFAQEHIFPTITDLAQIRKSRALPMRFLNAYRNAPSLRWSWALELGLNDTLTNIPVLGGRNLILVDVSPSMTYEKISEKSSLTYYDAATIFGAVMAVRNPGSELVQFGGSSNSIQVEPGASVLKIIEKFHQISYTDIPSAVRQWYYGYDRIIILTDEQTQGWSLHSAFDKSMTAARNIVPVKVPIYTWNLAGYKAGHQPANWENLHVFGGGFSDASFGMIQHIESGRSGRWPWEIEDSNVS
jgi:hypothetical protein